MRTSSCALTQYWEVGGVLCRFFLMLKAFQEQTIRKTQVFEWFSKSKSSVAMVEDAECSGHPLTSKTHENLDQFK